MLNNPIIIMIGLTLAGCIFAFAYISRKKKSLSAPNVEAVGDVNDVRIKMMYPISLTALAYGIMLLIMQLTGRSELTWTQQDILICTAVGALNLFGCAAKAVIAGKGMDLLVKKNDNKTLSELLMRMMIIEILPVAGVLVFIICYQK